MIPAQEIVSLWRLQLPNLGLQFGVVLMSFSRLSFAFKLAEQPDLYFTLDQQNGLTVKGDVALRASCNRVFQRIAVMFAETLAHTSCEKVSACLLLREQLNEYKRKNPELSPTLVQQVDALYTLIILKAATQDSSVRLTASLARASSPTQEITTEEYADCLMTTLKNLVDTYDMPCERAKLLPKNAFSQLRPKALVYLSGRMGDKSAKLFDLEESFFKANLTWWQSKAQKLALIPDESSLRGQRLLNQKVDKPTNLDFETLVYPRNLLFIEKVALYHLISFTTAYFVAMQKVGTLLKSGLEASYEQVTPTRKAIVFHPEQTGILELGLLLQTKRACLRIVKHGVESSVEIFIQKLLAYKEQKDCDLQFYDLCIEMLTINELLYKSAVLHDEWPKFDCAGKVLSYKDPKERYFSAISYFPRKRLKFLHRSGMYLHHNFRESGATLTLHSVQEKETIAILYTKIFKEFVLRFINNDDKILYDQLATKIVECRNNSRDKTVNLYNFEQIAFENRLLRHEYVWRLTDGSSYQKICDGVERANKGVIVKVPYLAKKLSSDDQPAVLDKDFLSDIRQPPPPAVKTQKRKKPPSSSRSPSPPQPVGLVNALAKLTLVDAPSAVEVKEVAPQVLEKIKKPQKQPKLQPSIPALFYASRVTEWFCPIGSKNDPFIKYPKYSAGKFSPLEVHWIRARHSYADTVDKYLAEGIETTDAQVLKFYKAKRRIQLVGDITITSGLITQTKTGVFTYSIGKTGRIFHRWFTSKNGKEIVSPETEKGWNVLNEPQPEDVAGEIEEKLAADGSYVEVETENLVVVVDPKNSARIRIVKLLSIDK